MFKSTGATAYCPDEVFLVCGKFLYHFSTKVFAILMHCIICIDKIFRDICIHIFSDMKAVLLPGMNLPPVMSRSTIPYFVSSLNVTVSLSIGCLVIRVYKALKLLLN